MEYLDLLDENGAYTGEQVLRGTKLANNRNILVVHIFLQDSLSGRYLLQKRSMSKGMWPGLWDITTGAVTAGESVERAALREVQEELGLTLERNRLIHLARLHRHPAFWDIWFARLPLDPAACRLQVEEVDAVALFTKDEMLDLYEQENFRDRLYKETILEKLPATAEEVLPVLAGQTDFS